MPPWTEITTAAPALAAAVQERFEAHGLGILATLRADGFPRLSGIEPMFTDEVWLGMMDRSRKALDLLRDPRLSLHNATTDKAVLAGDAKITGLAVAVTDDESLAKARADFGTYTGQEPPPGPMHLFRIDLHELAFVRPGGDHLVIESWTTGRGLRRVERR